MRCHRKFVLGLLSTDKIYFGYIQHCIDRMVYIQVHHFGSFGQNYSTPLLMNRRKYRTALSHDFMNHKSKNIPYCRPHKVLCSTILLVSPLYWKFWQELQAAGCQYRESSITTCRKSGGCLSLVAVQEHCQVKVIAVLGVIRSPPPPPPPPPKKKKKKSK